MTRRWTRWTLWLAIGVAAVSVGLAAGPLPWRFAGESGLPPATSAPTPGRAPDAVSIEPILALSPFGRIVGPDPVAGPAEETALGLTLHGVVIASDPSASTAIVSTESAPARAYVVGDTVAGSAALDQVFADHVVLRVDGRRETLSFPERQGSGMSASDAGVAALRALVQNGNEGASPDPQPVQTETFIEDYRNRIRDNPQTVLDNLGLEAGDDGYTVGPEASGNLLRAGLQPGDVVSQVNGQQVGNIEADRDLFDEVVASGRARIEIVRNGQRIVMSFPLR